MALSPWILAALLLLAALGGALAAWLAASLRHAAAVAALRAERDLLRERERGYAERLADLRSYDDEDSATAAALAPLRESMTRLERQVGVLERDRLEQYGQLAERLTEVTAQTGSLRAQTASLVGALNASAVRGAWGEAQLRRVCEHAGMLPHCDFEEQVAAVAGHDAAVRPDVLVRLPGDRCLVVDAKAPLAAFLAAQAEELSEHRRRELLTDHASALRSHVEALAAKRYWSAFTSSPELVVCFVPTDAMLAAALSHDPGLYDAAQARKVVLASPATLLALLRSVAFSWRQDSVAANARELVRLGEELAERLGTVGRHLGAMGGSLRRSVETYNALVGTLEGRVLVTARRLHDLGLADRPPPEVGPVTSAPRPLTAAELIDADVRREAAPAGAGAAPQGAWDAPGTRAAS